MAPRRISNLASSYRPISLTSCIAKVFERMVSYRLMWLLEKEERFTSCQAGYRRHRSTADHLVYLQNKILETFSRRHHAVAVFFDVEKAFDMTWRHGVLQTLYNWGLKGNLPKLISSFLQDRQFRVRVGNTLSTSRTLENGIPQGSTLSVVLFAIAINSITASISDDVSTYLYVDDLTLVYSGPSMGEINRKMQQAIDSIVLNSHKCGFKLSVDKSYCMHFCRLRKPHDGPMLLLQDRYIECKPTGTFLGVLLDSALTWKMHIDNLITYTL
uniref:Reverse transcriptase domain-containing protein n=1 Tax=Photinus pyralis TaxID=7054 RepID=A0A1Y1KMZ0_PHOPY